MHQLHARTLRVEYLLPHTERAALWARRLTGLYLGREDTGRHPVDTCDAAVVVSELVINAVRHTHGACRLRLCLYSGHLSVEVHDDSPARLRPRPAGGEAEDGRGLALVGAIAQTLDVRSDPGGGKTVRAKLSTDRKPAGVAGGLAAADSSARRRA
ncbi:ATP-binding protein [Streptomyces sp. NPDC045456]|uniref:ATP-binding protein n=1 Tax=Streptomyces sp. NPDC045456 TaxID=3155254 RepID=UPI0034025456